MLHARRHSALGPFAPVMVLAVVLLFSFARPAHADTIVLAADEWCPYNCTPGSDAPGFMVEVARQILTKAGHDVKYEVLPWARALKGAEEGEYSAAIGVDNEEGANLMLHAAEPLGFSGADFFVKKGDAWKYAGIDSLKDVDVGAIKDYGYGEDLDGYLEGASGDKAQLISGDEPLATNIKKLLSGRIDTFIDDRNVVGFTAKSMGHGGKLQYAGTHGEPSALFIGFSAKNPSSQAYVKLMEEGVAAMRASGELKKILEKYGLEDWK